jgi:hypothetical protein
MKVGLPCDDIWNPMVPRPLVASRIWSQGGCTAISGVIGQDLLNALKAEAEVLRPSGRRTLLPISDRTEGRGGSPARALRSSSCGEVHQALHASRQLTDTICQICGIAVSSTGVGTYHFYEQEGDFFALHRDFVGCDIAVITCISQCATEAPMGELVVYPNQFGRVLSQVRAAGKAVGLAIPLAAGDTAILLGGLLPHEVTPVAAGQDRIVAVNCYRLREM